MNKQWNPTITRPLGLVSFSRNNRVLSISILIQKYISMFGDSQNCCYKAVLVISVLVIQGFHCKLFCFWFLLFHCCYYISFFPPLLLLLFLYSTSCYINTSVHSKKSTLFGCFIDMLPKSRELLR
jgi:hypothetical protein